MEGFPVRQDQGTDRAPLPDSCARLSANQWDARATVRGLVQDGLSSRYTPPGVLPNISVGLGRQELQVGVDSAIILRSVERLVGRKTGVSEIDPRQVYVGDRSGRVVGVPPEGLVRIAPGEQAEVQRNRDGSEVTTHGGNIVKIRDRVGNVTEFKTFDKDGNPTELSRTNRQTGQIELWQKDERGQWRQFVHDHRSRGLIATGQIYVGTVRGDREGNVTYTGEGGKSEVKHKSDGARVLSEVENDGVLRIKQVVRTSGIVLDVRNSPTGEIAEYKITNSRNGHSESWTKGADGQWHQKDSGGRPTGRKWDGAVSIDEQGNFRAQAAGSATRIVYRTDGSTVRENVTQEPREPAQPLKPYPARPAQLPGSGAEVRGSDVHRVEPNGSPVPAADLPFAKKDQGKASTNAAREFLNAQGPIGMAQALEALIESAKSNSAIATILKASGVDIQDKKQMAAMQETLRKACDGEGEIEAINALDDLQRKLTPILQQELRQRAIVEANAAGEKQRISYELLSPAGARRTEYADGSILDVNAQGKVIGIKNVDGREFKFVYGQSGVLAEVISGNEHWTRRADGKGWSGRNGAQWNGTIEVDKDGNLQFTGEDLIAVQHRLNGDVSAAYPDGSRFTKFINGYSLKEYQAPDKSAVAFDVSGRVTYVSDGGQPPKERKFFYNKDTGELEAIKAIDGQIWRKSGPGLWQSDRQRVFKGELSVDKDGLIHYQPVGGNPVVLRRDGKLQNVQPR